MNKYIGVKLIDAKPAICCNKNFFKSFAVEKAKDKIWEVLGFVLQWGINGIKKK